MISKTKQTKKRDLFAGKTYLKTKQKKKKNYNFQITVLCRNFSRIRIKLP